MQTIDNSCLFSTIVRALEMSQEDLTNLNSQKILEITSTNFSDEEKNNNNNNKDEIRKFLSDDVGYLKLLKHFDAKGISFSEKTILLAIVEDKIECVRFLLNKGIVPSLETIEIAAGENPEIFKTLIKSMEEIKLTSKMFINAVKNDKYETLTFLHKINYSMELFVSLSDKEKSIVIESGFFWHFEFLHKTGYITNKEIINVCWRGNSDMIEYAIQNGFQIKIECFSIIARRGFKRCLELMLDKKNNCRFCMHKASTVAAHTGNIEILEMLRGRGLKIYRSELRYAALKGNKECVEYCLNFFNTDLGTLELVAETGKPENLKILVDNFMKNSEHFNCVDHMYRKAINGNKTESLKILQESGLKPSENVLLVC